MRPLALNTSLLARIMLTALVACTVLPATAQTPDTQDTLSRRVQLNGLDLAKPNDRGAVEHRVWQTARHVCRTMNEGGVDQASKIEACTTQSFNFAMAQVDQAIALRSHTQVVADASK
jgi:UrcA family protein